MDYGWLDPLGKVRRQPHRRATFGDAAYMKLFGIFGFSTIGSES